MNPSTATRTAVLRRPSVFDPLGRAVLWALPLGLLWLYLSV
jgi:hypothetical protein